ncbi:hypothetical protein ACYBSK_00445 [Streptomyces sp. BYX5S]
MRATPVLMRRAVHGEWTKLRTVPGQLWTVLALPAAMTALTALVAAGSEPAQEGTLAPTALSLSGVYLAQTVAALIGVATVCGDYPRLIRLTLAVNPRRTVVFTAKTLVVAVTVAVVALPAVLGSLWAGRAALTAEAAQLPLTSPALWRATLGTALYLLLVALLAVGVALTVRHAASAIGAVMTLLYGPYLVTLIARMPLDELHRLQRIAPMTAGLAVQTTTGTGTAPLAPWTGLAVLGAYAGGALVAGWLVLRLRDA